MDEAYIEPLSSRAGLTVLGGKAWSLASLVQGGFPVPDGFCLTTSAYGRFIESAGFGEALVDAARPELRDGLVSFDTAARRIRAMFRSAEVPTEVADEIRFTHERVLDGSLSAVRSSATAEDRPDYSFAGQQDSYLNVPGDRLLDSIRDCWASLWTARAMSYRYQMGIEASEISMAVVVQRMVPAEVSGILFTANPVTGSRTELVVNSSYGLGEAIVGGLVTPDSFVVSKDDLSVRDVDVAPKARMLVAADGGGVEDRDVGAEQRSQASLDETGIKHLAETAIEIERHFAGTPQDIEWLYADGRLWILQSRPITNLRPPPLENVSWDPPEPGAYLGRSQLVEHIPDPVSTLFEDLHMKRSLQIYWGRNLARAGNHAFEDTQAPASFVTSTTVNGFAYRQLGEPPRRGRLRKTRRRRLPGAWLRLWFKARMYLGFVPRWRFVSLPRYLRSIEHWRELDPPAASVEQLWTGIREMSKADARYWYDNGVWNAFALTRGTEQQLQVFLDEQAPGEFTTGQFLSGLPSPAFEAQVALHSIASSIRRDSDLFADVVATPPLLLGQLLRGHPRAGGIRKALEEYAARYGHQIFTLDFAEPCEAEQPDNLMRSLHALVLRTDYDPGTTQSELARRRASAMQSARSAFRGTTYLRFRWRLWVARHFYPNREAAMFHMGRAWTVLRPLARELGRRLVDVGSLHEAEDVYFLDAEELGMAVRALVRYPILQARGRADDYPDGPGIPELAQRAADRHRLREARKYLTPPSSIPAPPFWAPRDETGDAQDNDPSTLVGAAVSPGTVSGPASLIMTPSDFANMQPGTILVCPTTTPAWTQLFPMATGLVTDIGGILAHGSIVAREYGIPAVLGVGDATRRIGHGAKITVDGDRGVVTIEERSV